MTWLLRVLGGASGGWIAAGMSLALLAAGAGGGYVARGVVDAPKIANLKTDYANCRAANQKARADGAEAVIAALKNGAAEVGISLDRLAARANGAAKARDNFQKELSNVAITHACGSSAAELVYRRAVAGAGSAGVGVRPKAVP